MGVSYFRAIYHALVQLQKWTVLQFTVNFTAIATHDLQAILVVFFLKK